MKITERQLRQLIREEVVGLGLYTRKETLNEVDPRDSWIYGTRFHRGDGEADPQPTSAFLTGLKHDYGVGLNEQEIAATMDFVEGDDTGFTTAYRKDPNHGWEVTPFDIFMSYYRLEMPYGIQKARDGDPYVWLADRIAEELEAEGSPMETIT